MSSTTVITNGGNTKLVGMINGAQKQGFSKVFLSDIGGVAATSLPAKNSENKGIRSTSFSLFEEKSCRLHFIAPDRYDAGQNTVTNDNLGVDVKEVLNKEDIHDERCSTCNLYVIKRDTLPRKDICPDYDDVMYLQPVQTPLSSLQNDSMSEDTTCLSYFTSSIPSGNGVLFRKSRPATGVVNQRGEMSQMTLKVPEFILPVSTGSLAEPLLDNPEPLLRHEPESTHVEIIKAIVYGGLLETITSLSIIVSAAGGDASTLNIVALSLANVFAGLLVLANSLMSIKDLTAQYQEQLGQPRHFVIHAAIAFISFLIFGLLPPIIYGFSFHKTDDKYLKLAALAAASLVIITVLSIGKAYAQRPPKAYLQTIFYYIALAVTVTGPAYVAGNLISMLLKKLNVFDSFASVSVLEAEAVKWSSSSY